MRIGVDGREFVKGKNTGTARYLRHFLKEAPRQKPDWEFFVFIHHGCDYRNSCPNVFVQKVPQPTVIFWDQIVLPALLRHFAVDRFLNPYLKYPLTTPCPMTLIINDLAAFEVSSIPLSRRFYFRSLVKRAARKARNILTISEYSRRRISSLLAIPSQRVHVVHLAVEESYRPLEKPDPALLSRYGIRAPYLLYVGDLKPLKNVGFLLETYAKLPAPLRERYQLVIAGSWGTGFSDVKRQSEALGIAARTICCGFIEEADLPKIYAQAALFVYPSLYEGFGLPPLEAMACGVPVVCSNRTSLPEVVGEGGLLLDPKDTSAWPETVQRLLTQDEARRQLAARGLARAKHFTLEKTAERFLKALEEE